MDAPGKIGSLVLGLLRDDGAVVYLNGVEVLRSNMPKGKITAATRAARVTAGAPEKQFFPAQLSPDSLRPGINAGAVEVHQANPTSSDISFDLKLWALPKK